MIKNKPIKRNPAIVQFSKDHHFSLLLVWKVSEGLRFGVDINRISLYIIFFFQNYLKKHFLEEEELLFKQLQENDDLRLIAEQDHQDIYCLIEKIKIKPDQLNLIEFANRLEQHIRFEERILFTHLQKLFSEDQLTFIAEQMEASQSKLNEDDWADTFWIKNKEVIK